MSEMLLNNITLFTIYRAGICFFMRFAAFLFQCKSSFLRLTHEFFIALHLLQCYNRPETNGAVMQNRLIIQDAEKAVTMKNRKNIRLFTLVEMLTVVGLIAVLMGMTIAIIPMVNRRAANTRTEATIKMIATALENYKHKYGFYPPTLTSGSPSTVKAMAFVIDQYDPAETGATNSKNIKNNMAQFFEIGLSSATDRGKMEAFTAEKTTGSGRYYFVDAFGMPIVYRCPGFYNRNSYDLGSLGEDKKWGTISTTVEKSNITDGVDESTYYTNANGFGKGDDIVNFKRK